MTESSLIRAILERFGSLPGYRLWRSNSGVAYSPSGRAVRFGWPGQADITGIGPGGRRIEIEVKVRGKQSEQQQKFAEMIRKMGGVYILARSAEDVEAVLR